MHLSLACLLAASSCLLIAGAEFDQRFREWLSEYEEVIARENLEPAQIYPNWLENAKYVDAHNSLEHGYKLKLNAFAYKKFAPDYDAVHSPKDAVTGHQDLKTSAMPPPVDWRGKGVLPPVRDQGSPGFSAPTTVVESIEALTAIKTGDLYSLSVQEVVNCCQNFTGSLYQCIARIGGLATDDDYPQDSDKCVYQEHKPVATISGGKRVRQSELSLAQAVAIRPVVVSVVASGRSFQMYHTGIYNDPLCSDGVVDHAMLLVGYSTTDSGTEYWILQNSWGSSWGAEGFMLIKKNANMCKIDSEASYPY